MERRRCAACEQAFRPRTQSPGQLYCGQAPCQRERRRRWQRSKRQRDEDYRANQARAQRVWAADHRDYWRGWRAAHPEYTERNRVAQRRRAADVTSCKDGRVPADFARGIRDIPAGSVDRWRSCKDGRVDGRTDRDFNAVCEDE
jgi:hypothetical protein